MGKCFPTCSTYVFERRGYCATHSTLYTHIRSMSEVMCQLYSWWWWWRCAQGSGVKHNNVCVCVSVSLCRYFYPATTRQSPRARSLTLLLCIFSAQVSLISLYNTHIARVRFVHFVCVFCGFSWIITFNYIFECRAVRVLASNFSVALSNMATILK